MNEQNPGSDSLEALLQRSQYFGIDDSEQPRPFVDPDDQDFPITLTADDGGSIDPLEELHVAHVTKFFTRNLIRDRVISVVEHKTPCSLRDLFWLVTNYCKLRRTRYIIPGEDFPVNLHEDYQQWMDHYGKDYFDTYQRGGRHFVARCDEDPQFFFRGTISQFIWFEWAIRRLVVEYAATHLDDIRSHQKEKSTETKRRHEAEGKNFKRQPLTERPQPSVMVLPGQVTLRVNY